MNKPRVAIVGSGPSALMCADVVACAGYGVDLFEKRPAFGRKLLIAGSSGLNVGNSLPLPEFLQQITPNSKITNSLDLFFTPQWIEFLEKELGLKTFLGTSKRYFLQEMHAVNFLKNWLKRLQNNNVTFYPHHELHNFEKKLKFKHKDQIVDFGPYDCIGFFLGGGSWEEEQVTWPQIFKDKNFSFEPFASDNVGYHVESWSEPLLKEAEGEAIKDCLLTTDKGEKRGDLIITKNGIEGTPVYFVGTPGIAYLDMLPSKQLSEILTQLQTANLKEKLSPLRRIKKSLNLSKAALALLFHLTTDEQKNNLVTLCSLLKKFPLNLTQARPLLEAISSKGGISLDEVDENLMSKKLPGIFLGGEMLNWSAPTGGFLIQLCISQGFLAGKGMVKKLATQKMANKD